MPFKLPFELNILISLAVMIFVGMCFGRLAKHLRLPNVTGYLVGGLVIGPSVLGLIPAETLAGFDLISEVALGFIAFSIGSEFRISYFKRVGAAPIVIAVFESLFAILFVLAGLLITGHELPFSIVLASIAAATAPAATIMVIKQYKAKGSVTETLLSVVALDDATALIMFGISVAIAQAIANPGASSIALTIAEPFIQIFAALLIGGVLGLVFAIPLKFFNKDGNRLALIFGFIFLGIGVADLLGVSSLLLCMALGATLSNFSDASEHIMKLTDFVTPPIFILFFVTSGAELQLSVIPSIGIAGIVYVIMRVVGKIAGTYVGGTICHADKKIRKYIGPALIPQAGVAIGLSLVAKSIVPQYADTVRAIILCGTLIYEIIGPAVSKLTLKCAGEIVEEKQPSKPAVKTS